MMGRFSWIKLTVDELPLEKLGKCELRVYLALTSDMDEEGVSRRTYRSLCQQTGLAERSVYRGIAGLLQTGVIEKVNAKSVVSGWRILMGARAGRS